MSCEFGSNGCLFRFRRQRCYFGQTLAIFLDDPAELELDLQGRSMSQLVAAFA